MKSMSGMGAGVIAALFLFGCAIAEPLKPEPLTEHTYRWHEATSNKNLTLEQLHWLVGSWEGEAFGSRFEEVWNRPSAGSMVGLFKLMDNNKVSFYEILVLHEVSGSIEMAVKHFGADFIAWEDKEDFVRFKLISADDQAIHFGGLSFYRTSKDEITGYIVFKNSDGSVYEQKLSYRRRSN